MGEKNNNWWGLFIVGCVIGMLATAAAGGLAYLYKKGKIPQRYLVSIKELARVGDKLSPVSKNLLFLSFENGSDLEQVEAAGGVDMERAEAHAAHGQYALQVTLPEGQEFPGITWEVFGGQVQDWSGQPDFHFNAYNNTEISIQLEVKFKSGKDYPKQEYSFPVRLEPLKMNRVEIPLDQVAQSCDLTRMSYVKVFAKSPSRPLILYVDNFGVREPGDGDAAGSVETDVVMVSQRHAAPLEEGLNVFVASSLDRIFEDGNTLLKPNFTTDAVISAARNEYEPFQVVVKAGADQLTGVRLVPGNLTSEDGAATLSAEHIAWRVVGYVPTEKPYYPVKYVGRWPDPLLYPKPVDVAPDRVQPFWVTVYVPSDTPAGTYQGTIQVATANGEILQDVPLRLKVYDFTLPRESTLKTAFDFYGHETYKRYPRGEREAEAAYQQRLGLVNQTFIINMLKYRMNPVLNVDPTNDAELAEVDRYRVYGLNNFSIGKRGGTLNNNWPVEDEKIGELMMQYRTYGEILKLNRLLPYTYIYTWDEGEMGNPQVAKVASMVHKAYPGLKNMVCYHGFWDPDKHPDWGNDIDIWTFQIDSFDPVKMKTLQEKGKEIWMYISGPGGTGAPNLALDFDSIDYRIIAWLCWKYDIKGFLYWCTNWWPLVDPFVSAKNTKWEQNGNGLLFYPGEEGPVPSLRAEVFRDGMEDYEYIQQLMQRLKVFKAAGLAEQHPGVMEEDMDILTVDSSIAAGMESFTKDGAVIETRRKAIAEQIVKLDHLLREAKSRAEAETAAVAPEEPAVADEADVAADPAAGDESVPATTPAEVVP